MSGPCKKNVVLVGVIPGPKEPPLHMNTFLRLLVDELKELWRGIPLKNAKGHSIIVRAALLCCGCDIPASRKLCGLRGHHAEKGCSKCLLTFPTEVLGEKADCSNFNQSLCPPPPPPPPQVIIIATGFRPLSITIAIL